MKTLGWAPFKICRPVPPPRPCASKRTGLNSTPAVQRKQAAPAHCSSESTGQSDGNDLEFAEGVGEPAFNIFGIGGTLESKNIFEGIDRFPEPVFMSKEEAEITLSRRKNTNRYSEAQKRKWQDPEYREKVIASIKKKWQDDDYRKRVSNALKGKKSWNEGKKFTKSTKKQSEGSANVKALKSTSTKGKKRTKQAKSERTKQLMSLAHTGSRHSVATRRKMSSSHTGLSHSPETMQMLSQKLKGVPKSAQHKARIGASQRKRYAARRALQAIEALHTTASPLLSNCRRSRYMCSALSSMTNPSPAFGQKQTRAEVLNTYKCLLREYRELQEELSPWMHAFEEDHSRRPSLVDVESTKIPWLIEKFKDYVVMREKLFIGIPELRHKIRNAQADFVVDPVSPNTSIGASATTLSESCSGLPASTPQYMKGNEEKPRTFEARTSQSIVGGSGTLPRTSARVKKAMDAAMEYKKQKQARTSQVGKREKYPRSMNGLFGNKCDPTSASKLDLQDQKIQEAQEKARNAVMALECAKEEVARLYSQESND